MLLFFCSVFITYPISGTIQRGESIRLYCQTYDSTLTKRFRIEAGGKRQVLSKKSLSDFERIGISMNFIEVNPTWVSLNSSIIPFDRIIIQCVIEDVDKTASRPALLTISSTSK